jgi:hypothetical protein
MALTKRTKTTTILSLSIGVWNVNGLVSKDFNNTWVCYWERFNIIWQWFPDKDTNTTKLALGSIILVTKRTKTTTILSLSIGVWNVNGLVSKDFYELNDVSFLNCIKSLDIVGLVETHTTSSWSSRTRIFSHKVLRDIEHFIDRSS